VRRAPCAAVHWPPAMRWLPCSVGARMAAAERWRLCRAGTRMVSELSLRSYLDKFDRKYWATYKVLDILQKVAPVQSDVDGGQHLGLSSLRSCPRCSAPCSAAPAPACAPHAGARCAGVLSLQPGARGVCRDVRV